MIANLALQTFTIQVISGMQLGIFLLAALIIFLLIRFIISLFTGG